MGKNNNAARGAAVQNKLAKQAAAGIPDSPIFTQPREEQENPILKCHVGGMPVSQLPPEVHNLLVYEQTDEGVAERNARENVRPPSGITLGADVLTKRCEERRDSIVDRGMEPWEAPNAMQEVADAHVRPGFKGKFLSPAKLEKQGKRGYEIVVDAGEPVKLRNMILGEMPIDRVKKRNRHYQEKAAAAAGEIKRNYLREGGETAVDLQGS